MSHFGSGRPSIGGAAIGGGRPFVPKPTSAAVYSFPSLPPSEIIEKLRQNGMVVSEDDLNKPKSEQFRQILEQYVIAILGISKEEMYSPYEEFAPRLGDTPELHEESVPVVHFLRNINKVLQLARCEEGLTLHDVMKPERTRVIRILSGIMNLVAFQEEKQPWYQERQGKKAELLEKKAAIIAKQEEVRQRIAQEKAIREAEQPAIDQVTIQRKHLKEELERMMVKNDSARSATSEGKAEVVALRDAKRDLLAQVDSIKAETEVRKGQIVGSPARLKGELAALEAAVEAEQRAMDELDEHKRLLMRQTDIVAKAEKDVNKALRMISETEVEMKKVKSIMKDEKQRKAEAEAVGGDVDALQGQVEHAVALRKRAEDKLAEIKEAYAQKAAALDRAIEATRRESAELSDEIKTATDQRRAAEAQKLQLERQQEAYTAKHSADVASMIATMKHFAGAVTTYNGSLLQSLERIDSVPLIKPEGGMMGGGL